MSTALLQVTDLNAYYGHSHVLQGVSFDVGQGQVATLLGRNGAGKTTTLKAIMGVVPPRGSIRLADQAVSGLSSHRIARCGIAYVPETRAVFPSLSVKENLTLAARGDTGNDAWTLERVYRLFPHLRERTDTGAGNLSGGEQQMLSIARALMTNPRLLLLDEPTEGLAPRVIKQIEDVLTELKRSGLTILLVEQNLAFATAFADTVLVLGKGRIRWRGTPAELRAEEAVKARWLGV